MYYLLNARNPTHVKRAEHSDYILKPINVDALRASLNRIAERQKMARANERSQAAFRALVEAAPSTIGILRPDHTLLYLSPFAAQVSGYLAHGGNIAVGAGYDRGAEIRITLPNANP